MCALRTICPGLKRRGKITRKSLNCTTTGLRTLPKSPVALTFPQEQFVDTSRSGGFALQLKKSDVKVIHIFNTRSSTKGHPRNSQLYRFRTTQISSRFFEGYRLRSLEPERRLHYAPDCTSTPRVDGVPELETGCGSNAHVAAAGTQTGLVHRAHKL